MKRIAHIQNNEIASVSLADDDWQLPVDCMLESDAIAAGLAYKQPDIQHKTWPSRVEFWNEFTIDEKVIITNHTNAMIKYFLTELSIWNSQVWSNDEKVVEALDLLELQQCITAERKQQILT